MTPWDLIWSLQGLLLLLGHLLQYSIFYFAAFLGFVDVNFAQQLDYDSVGRQMLFWLTIFFVVVTSANLFRSVYKSAKEMCELVDDKMITDVINDLY